MNKILVLLAAFFAITAARPSLEQLDTYTFEQFIKEYNLSFKEDELPQRRALFQSEIQRIKAHNAKNLSWKEGVNKFTVMTAAEKKAFFGHSKALGRSQKKSLKSARKLPDDFVLQPVDALPKHVDWREAGIVGPVKDQGHCGSCWAFASTATIESHVAKASGYLYDLSIQQIASCTPNPNSCGGTGGCQGATSELAFDYVSNSAGLFQEYQYSYQSYYAQDYACTIPSGKPVAAIDGYVQLPANNYTALLNAVARVGPVAIAVDASNWHSYESGIFNGCNQVNPDINHGVVLVGYGEEKGQKYWIVRNSWSPTFGERGFIRVARSDSDDSNCGSDITPQDGIACAGDNTPETVCGTCGVIFDSSYPLNAKSIAH
eukprot:gene13233-14529_t